MNSSEFLPFSTRSFSPLHSPLLPHLSPYSSVASGFHATHSPRFAFKCWPRSGTSSESSLTQVIQYLAAITGFKTCLWCCTILALFAREIFQQNLLEGTVWCQCVINSVSKALLSFYCWLLWLSWMMASWDGESLTAFTERWDMQLTLGKTIGDTVVFLGKCPTFIQKTTGNSRERKINMEELYMKPWAKK